MDGPTLAALDRAGPVLLVLVALGAALAAGLVFVALFGRSSEQRHVDRRLADLAIRLGGPQALEARVASLRRDSGDSGIPGIDAFIRRWIPNRRKLRARLEAADAGLSVAAYVLTSAGIAATAAGLVWLGLRWPLPLDLMIGALVGLALPHLTVGYLIGRRQDAFIALFPEAIDLIVRGLRSGLPVTESITAVAREIKAPVGTEFAAIENGLKFGRTLDELLWETSKRIDTPEFKFFVISLSLQRETGGNLAETLDKLSDILRRRRQMKLKIKAMSSEARASALIIGSLPFIMTGVLFAVAPKYMSVLLDDPRGWVLIGLGLVMMAAGAGVMAKLVKFEI